MSKTARITDVGLEERQSAVGDQQGEFPVEWTDPSEADLEWEWDDMHFPQALNTLSRRLHNPGAFRGDQLPSLTMRAYLCVPIAVFSTDISILQTSLPTLKPSCLRSGVPRQRTDNNWPVNCGNTGTIRFYHRCGRATSGCRDAPIETTSLAEVADAWQRMWREVLHIWGLHFMVVAGTYQSLDDLSDLYESLIEGAQASEVLVLMQGLSADLQNVQRDLYLLVEQARNNPAVAASILSEKPLEDIGSVEGGAEFSRLLDAFLNEHGHLGQPFEDLAFPSWADEPSLIMAEVRKRLDRPDPDPEVQRLRLRSQADEREAKIRERIGGQTRRPGAVRDCPCAGPGRGSACGRS